MMTATNLHAWRESDYAKEYFVAERGALNSAMKQAIGPSVLQIGDLLDGSAINDLDLPFLVNLHFRDESISTTKDCSQLLADPAFLPFAEGSFSTLVLPHVLELSELPHQVLREAYRVLMPEGHIVVSGFNPYSFMGWQRYIHKRAVAPGRYYPCGRVIDWLQLLGFEVTASSMFHYTPLLKNTRLRHYLRFWESVGDRWLPMTGGGYMITAKKRMSANLYIGRRKNSKLAGKLTPAAAAKSKEKA